MKRLVWLLLALCLAAPLAACNSAPDEAHTLSVLAGSELKDLEPLLPDLEKATGVRLQLNYIGTLDGAEKIADGDPSDAAWFSHAKYMQLLPDTASHIKASQSIMLSPVIIGVKQSVARNFGWENNPAVTWKDIQEKAAAGQFHFAMTNPAASNSGFTALIGVASALSGSSDAIDTGQIDTQALKGFFSGQTVTAGSSGFLADTYVRQQDTVDGIINYESVLMGLNAGGQLHEPLDLIYPSEGIVTADYPFMLLNDSKRDAYDKVVAWLRTPDVQRRIMTDTARRPSIPGIPLDSRFPTQTLIELPFPSKLDTINALLTVYLDQIRRPASAVFVLDTSGSMEGERLDSLKQALNQLTGTDTSLTGQFSRFRTREEITLLTFSSTVDQPQTFTIDDANPNSPSMQEVRDAVDAMEAGGGTAIYSALAEAYNIVQTEQASDPNRLWSIVLMTDGENNDGIGPDTWRAEYQSLPQAVQDVHTYPILFGDSSQDDMQAIADLTGGRLFDAQSSDLETIFKQIRGYQ
jgi:Ca-activated chloride channel family protein